MPLIAASDIQLVDKTKQTIVINDCKVYDITKFVNVHPGGRKTLSCRHGKDITKVMKDGPHKHSPNAYKWLEQYLLGDYYNDLEENAALEKENPNSVEVVDGVLKVVQPKDKESSKDLVDWDKPILWQVGHLGAAYHDWVDDPVDKPLRLFYSDVCEYFSKTRWFVIPLVWFPITALFLWTGYHDLAAMFNHSAEKSMMYYRIGILFAQFCIGIFGWSFLEYSLHRWLFHSDPPITSYFLITVHFLLHGQHHKVPFDSHRLVFPPVPAAGIGSIIYTLMKITLPRMALHGIISGVIFGYVCYDLTHYYLHYGSPVRGSYFDRLRAYHVRHHFESPELGFGISSKFWDYPFQTLIPLDKKNKSY